MKFVLSLLINGFVIYFAGKLLGGVVVESYFTAIIAAIFIGIVNFFVKPILTILTLPLTIMSLGLFLLVINGVSILLASSMVPGFFVAGIVPAILFSIILAIANIILANMDRSRTEQY